MLWFWFRQEEVIFGDTDTDSPSLWLYRWSIPVFICRWVQNKAAGKLCPPGSWNLCRVFIMKKLTCHSAVCSETHVCLLHLPPQGEEEFDMPQPARGHVVHRHMRTIHEVRTLVTRVITDVYYVDGTEVERKVTEVLYTVGLCGKFLSIEKLLFHFMPHPQAPFLSI